MRPFFAYRGPREMLSMVLLMTTMEVRSGLGRTGEAGDALAPSPSTAPSSLPPSPLLGPLVPECSELFP
jgi:hypothetical protein